MTILKNWKATAGISDTKNQIGQLEYATNDEELKR